MENIRRNWMMFWILFLMLKLKSYYDDQCRSRNLFIGPVDVEKTEKLLEIEISEAKKDERERTMEERKQRETEGKIFRLNKVSWDKVELGDEGFEDEAGGGNDHVEDDNDQSFDRKNVLVTISEHLHVCS